MVNDSRTGIYDYVERLLLADVTENVYCINEPQELTEHDTRDGFVVIHVGDFIDGSEFSRNAYGWARVFIETFIPWKSGGRWNRNLYKSFEDNIALMVKKATEDDGEYYVQEDSVLSSESYEDRNANNMYSKFIKSFIVVCENTDEIVHYGDLYFGSGSEALESMNDVLHLNNLKHYNVGDVHGVYSVDIDADGEYLWVCTTSDLTSIKSRGTDIPMEAPVVIGNLKCYRSSNPLMKGKVGMSIVCSDGSEEPYVIHGNVYIGFKADDSEIATKNDILTLNDLKDYNKEKPFGDYAVTFNDTYYMWICSPVKFDLVVSNGFEVPMTDALFVDGLWCRRTSNRILRGEMEFTIKY